MGPPQLKSLRTQQNSRARAPHASCQCFTPSSGDTSCLYEPRGLAPRSLLHRCWTSHAVSRAAAAASSLSRQEWRCWGQRAVDTLSSRHREAARGRQGAGTQPRNGHFGHQKEPLVQTKLTYDTLTWTPLQEASELSPSLEPLGAKRGPGMGRSVATHLIPTVQPCGQCPAVR